MNRPTELKLALTPKQRRQVARAWFRVVAGVVFILALIAAGAALTIGLLALGA